MQELTVVAFDTETALMRPGMMAPELACVTFAEIVRGRSQDPGIMTPDEAKGPVRMWLTDPSTILVGQNVAYDLAVIGARWPDLVGDIFAAYRANRITDTMIRQQLLDIAAGCYRGYVDDENVWHKNGYKLFDLVRRHLGGRLLKKDGWRLRYNRFIDVPLSEWRTKARELQDEARRLLIREASSDEKKRYYDGHDQKDLLAILEDPPEQAIQYPLDDATTTRDVYLAQERSPDPHGALKNQWRETYAAFVLHLCSIWGIRTNAAGVDVLEKEAQEETAIILERLMAEGLVRADGSRDTKRAALYMETVCTREEIPVRRTAKGAVCLDNDACHFTEDPLLLAYADFTQLGKTMNADVPMLRKGVRYPVHCRYGLADTSRTTCSGPNLQNLRKKVGLRECIVPRPGHVFIQADFPQLELYTLAQVCMTWFGHSALGDMLIRGIDPHTAFAADLLGISYDEGVIRRKSGDKYFYNMRQLAKAFNFGSPGGLGDKKLVALAASPAYKVALTESEARRYKHAWLRTFPEMPEFFQRAEETMNGQATATVVIPQSGHIRGGARYNAICNTPFQGLGAACAKAAMMRVAEAEYTDVHSSLFGARTVVMVHDEIIAECREAICHEAATELATLMVAGANEFLPDVPIDVARMEPLVMRYWSKDAEPTYKDGRLVPWGRS